MRRNPPSANNVGSGRLRGKDQGRGAVVAMGFESRYSTGSARPSRRVGVEPQRRPDFVIFGGEDHKTGQATDTSVLRSARAHAAPRDRRRRGDAPLVGEVIETPDGLPYIGETSDAAVLPALDSRQRHDVRNAHRHDGRRWLRRTHGSMGGPVRIQAARRSWRTMDYIKENKNCRTASSAMALPARRASRRARCAPHRQSDRQRERP